MKKFTAFLLALSVILVVFAGCSGSDDKDGKGTSGEGTLVQTGSVIDTVSPTETDTSSEEEDSESISPEETSETESEGTSAEDTAAADSDTTADTVDAVASETQASETRPQATVTDKAQESTNSQTSKTPVKTEATSTTKATSTTTAKPATSQTTPSPTQTSTSKQDTSVSATTTEPSKSDEPEIPAEPAVSYQLKSDKQTDPSADYNTPKVSESGIFEGAGPLTNSNIYVGKNDFMFIGATVADYEGTNLWSDAKLKKFAKMMSERAAWAEENDIELYLVFCPNKATVYGDYVPSTLTGASYTRLDQIVEYMNTNTSVNVIDLSSTMINARSLYGDSLYYKYDTHWTQHAGFVAYGEIMKNISADLPSAVTYSKDSFNINYYETYMKDMPYLLGYYDKYYDEGPVYSLKYGPDASLVTRIAETPEGQFDFAFEWPNGFRDNLVLCKFVSKNTEAPKLYMYRDSFGIAIVPFMKESFSESTFDWSRNFSRQDILESGADVVVIQVVEKYLPDLLAKKTFID